MAGTNELFPLLLGLSFAMVIWLNRDFYRFLASRRGWLFTVQAFVLHLLYFCNCGLSLLLGVGAHCFDQVRGPAKKYKELRRPA
jgi:hypothetical protein